MLATPDHQTAVRRYLEHVQQLGPEAARAQAFGTLLHSLFGERPGFLRDLLAGVQRPVQVHEGALVRRGRVDNLCGSLVVEFERGLRGTGRPGEQARGKLAEAQEQLRRYVAALWSEDRPEQRLPFLAMATDGVLFAVYTPLAQDPEAAEISAEDVTLQPLTRDLVDLGKLHAEEQAVNWLDRYFLRQVQLPPRTAEIIADFGVDSHAFRVCLDDLSRLWAQVENEPEFSVLFESWDNYLRIAYGTSFRDRGGRELFLRHTYLATLAKLMVWARFMPEDAEGATGLALGQVLSGEAFQQRGILNFLEEDFFAWVTRAPLRERAVAVARRLIGALASYHLARIDEDVLKGLYEQLVDPEGRHDLGEYYTPDWLAARLVRELLDGRPPAARALDPACGSGTFLHQAILYKKQRLRRGGRRGAAPGLASADVLEAIAAQVVGIDVHPVAVIIAKANYLLALGDLLDAPRRAFAVPVYLANAIRRPPPQPSLGWQAPPGVPGVALQPDPQTDIVVFVPHQVGADPELCDVVVDACRDYARENLGHALDRAAFGRALRRRVARLPDSEAVIDALFGLCSALVQFMQRRRDSIQAYVLKNLMGPVFLRGQFDVLVGNPPWLSFRYIQAPEYQSELRSLVRDYRLAAGAHLATQMELATLFLVRCADIYLGERGSVGLVLPRSVFNADQHHTFRTGQYSRPFLRLTGVWDLESVAPLFNVPACVVLAEKDPWARTDYPIPGRALQGELPRRNAGATEADQALTTHDLALNLYRRDKRSFWAEPSPVYGRGASVYRARFVDGATLFPRGLWFVEVVQSSVGFDHEFPPVRTDPEAIEAAKPPWGAVRAEGSIEREFLYEALLSRDAVPFGLIAPHTAVLPVMPEGARYRVLDAPAAHREGCGRLAEWIGRAESAWREGRGEKSARMTAVQRLDVFRALARQDPRPGPRVLVTEAGTYPMAVALPSTGRPPVIEHKFYWYRPTSVAEASYLCAVVNSPTMAEALRAMQVRGAWGPRGIEKKLWDLPVPDFDRAQPTHARLARLGQRCARKVAGWLEAEKAGATEDERRAKVQQLRAAVGHTRRRVRQFLAEELAEIDALVKELLGL